MLIPPPTAPPVKGRENTNTGGHALAGASESNSNPNKRHAFVATVHDESSEDAAPQEVRVSRLIDRNPISTATQAALLALLSEPFAGTEGGSSFAEIVEEATLEYSAAEDQSEAGENT